MELVERLRSIAAYGCELSAASTITEAADLLEEALTALEAWSSAEDSGTDDAWERATDLRDKALTKSRGEKIDA